MQNKINITDWIAHSDSLFHQIFLIVMGGLYALAYLTGFTYKAMNIYCYFVFYPATFTLFLKSNKKYFILLGTLLFFVIPNIEYKSSVFFDRCVDFINVNVKLFHSTYVDVCIYWCVILPLLLYVPFVIKKFEPKTLKYIAIGILSISILYMALIYPNFKSWITHFCGLYPNYY